MVYESDLQSLKDRVNISRDYTTSISECEALISKLETAMNDEKSQKQKAEWALSLRDVRHALLHLTKVEELDRIRNESKDDGGKNFNMQLGRVNRYLDAEKPRI